MILQALLDGFALRRLLRRFCFDTFEQFCELGERIVGANVTFKFAPVINQITRNFQFLFANTIEGFYLAGVDDRRVETCLYSIVEEH